VRARRLARHAAWLAAVLLAGSALQPANRTESYRCAGGRQFALVLDARAGPRLDLSGMSFPVAAEAGREGVYACEVLTVWRDGRTAWLDVQGQPELRDCVRVP
jgi:hypothetical protein